MAGKLIEGYPQKSSPVAADVVPIIDSEAPVPGQPYGQNKWSLIGALPFIAAALLGAAGGAATLDSSGLVPVSELPLAVQAIGLIGTGAPSSALGVNGDAYLNYATGGVYTKASGAWSLAATLPFLATSAAGAAGGVAALDSSGLVPVAELPLSLQSITIAGAGAPSSALGVNGDAYLDWLAGAVYLKASGAWALQAVLLAGNGPTVTTLLGAGGELVMPRGQDTGPTPTSGTVQLTYFTAQRTESIAHVMTSTNGTAAAGVTAAGIGVYSVAANGNLTLLASVSDTSLWASTYTTYTRAWTVGGSAGSWTKTAGQTYAYGVLVAGTTMPVMSGTTYSNAYDSLAPRVSGSLAGQTSIPASIAAGSVANDYRRFQGGLQP